MLTKEPSTGVDGVTAVNETTALAPAPKPKYQPRWAPMGDPNNPSKREAEAMAALDAILTQDVVEWLWDEWYFEDTLRYTPTRPRAALLLDDILAENLTRPDHRVHLQTLARLLRQPTGKFGDAFSDFGYSSLVKPHEAYLAGMQAGKRAAAAMALAILAPMNRGVEVNFLAIGPGDDFNSPADWEPDPDDVEGDEYFVHNAAQRISVRLDDPKGHAKAMAFIRAYFGKKSLYMRSPSWMALTEWQPRSRDGDAWLADLARKAPSLKPALTLGTPAESWAIFPADANLARALKKKQRNVGMQDDEDAPAQYPVGDPLKKELNAVVTEWVPVPFTVKVNGVDFETRLVRPKRLVNDEDPTPFPLIEETALSDIARAETGTDAGGKPARAMAALLAAGAEFFNAPNGRLWVSFDGKLHRVSETDGCPALMAWLTNRGLSPSRTARSELFELMATAAVSGPTHHVHFRQAQATGVEPVAYLNLMDPEGRAVIVDAAGWRLAPAASLPVRMADRPKARPLPVPKHAEDGLTFFERLNRHVKLPPVVNASDPADAGLRSRAAILTTLVAQLYRPGAVPHMFLTGPEGASKTTTAKRLKALIDPDSVLVVTSMPKDPADLFLLAEQQPLLVIDNASGIQDPDIVAALATGAGHQKRQLYADSERTVFEAKSSLIFTSIVSDITQRPDLMDRVLPVALRPMLPSERKLEAELEQAWSDDLPYLLADLLDLVSTAIARAGKIKQAVEFGLLPPLPRLADAAVVAEAAAQAEGWQPGLLLEVLNAMRDTAKAEQLEANPVAVRIRALMDNNKGTWTGTATELLERLKMEDGPPWGREVLSVHTLAKALDRIVASLHIWGINVARGARSNTARTLTISRSGGANPPGEPSASEGGVTE